MVPERATHVSPLYARARSASELWISDLGRVPYAEALELQRTVARERISGVIPEDVLLLVEHPPVVTFGRSAKAAHLTASAELLAARGIEVYEVERGGDVTFHGPGQLVGYPIIDLKRHRQDLHWYLRQIEGALIDALATSGSRPPAERGSRACGPQRAARSPRLASTPATGSRGTALRST